MVPRFERILTELFTLFFSGDILLNRFAHEPMRRPTPRRRQALHAFLQLLIYLEARG
jgi:hypothetical protein